MRETLLEVGHVILLVTTRKGKFRQSSICGHSTIDTTDLSDLDVDVFYVNDEQNDAHNKMTRCRPVLSQPTFGPTAYRCFEH